MWVQAGRTGLEKLTIFVSRCPSSQSINSPRRVARNREKSDSLMICCDDELDVGDELVTVSTTTVVAGTIVDTSAVVGGVCTWDVVAVCACLVVVVAGVLAGVCNAEYP